MLKNNSLAAANLPPETVWRDAARSTHVTGEMFKDLANNHRVACNPAKWFAWLGAALVGIVEVSLPGNPWHMLWRHLASVLYLVELIVIATGFFFSATTVTTAGVAALVITLLLDILIWLLRRHLKTK